MHIQKFHLWFEVLKKVWIPLTTNTMDEVMVINTYFLLVSMDQQDTAILPAKHDA